MLTRKMNSLIRLNKCINPNCQHATTSIFDGILINLCKASSFNNKETSEPTIPPYEDKFGEPIKSKRARLLYQSRKRGMLENGIILSSFAHKYLDSMSDKELSLYDKLINLPSNDWEIYYWAAGIKPTPPDFDHEVMDRLKNFVRNEDKESRIRQPDLY